MLQSMQNERELNSNCRAAVTSAGQYRAASLHLIKRRNCFSVAKMEYLKMFVERCNPSPRIFFTLFNKQPYTCGIENLKVVSQLLQILKYIQGNNNYYQAQTHRHIECVQLAQVLKFNHTIITRSASGINLIKINIIACKRYKPVDQKPVEVQLSQTNMVSVYVCIEVYS